MGTLQIVLLSAIGALALASVVFMIMFIVEVSREEEIYDEVEVKSIFSSQVVEENTTVQTVDNMLANLDKQAEEETKVEPVTVQAVVETVEEPEEEVEETVEEVKEETIIEEEVKAEETKEETAEVSTENLIQEVVEEAPVEVSEAKSEPVINQINIVVNQTPVVEEKEETEEVEVVEEIAAPETADDEPITNVEGLETISIDALPDYKARLEKVKQNKNKLEKDLAKVQKAILNYERTKRRKARNQKMLDRRATELTNLNLVMYSVTDIKNVDEDKKLKQEELTSHIAELKASIQDADEFLASNKEKNEHNVKMAKFLLQENARYSEEIAELEKLIDKTETDSTTVA